MAKYEEVNKKYYETLISNEGGSVTEQELEEALLNTVQKKTIKILQNTEPTSFSISLKEDETLPMALIIVPTRATATWSSFVLWLDTGKLNTEEDTEVKYFSGSRIATPTHINVIPNPVPGTAKYIIQFSIKPNEYNKLPIRSVTFSDSGISFTAKANASYIAGYLDADEYTDRPHVAVLFAGGLITHAQIVCSVNVDNTPTDILFQIINMGNTGLYAVPLFTVGTYAVGNKYDITAINVGALS